MWLCNFYSLITEQNQDRVIKTIFIYGTKEITRYITYIYIKYTKNIYIYKSEQKEYLEVVLVEDEHRRPSFYHRFVTLSDLNFQITCTEVSRCDILSRMHLHGKKGADGPEKKKGGWREREREAQRRAPTGEQIEIAFKVSG